MTTPAPSLELARAAELLQTNQRDAAGRLLKAYLSQHPRDAEGWWLMSQAVRQPANVRSCLERVLRLRPDDARARARLAQLDQPDEPDDSFFSFSPPPVAPPPDVSPAARLPTYTTGALASFDPTLDLGVTFDPFAGIETEADPFVALRDQAPIRLHQSETGAGSAGALPVVAAPPAERDTTRRGASSTLIGVLVLAFALIVLAGALLMVARQRGWLRLNNLPEMRALDGGSFALEYPEDWGGLCLTDTQGDPVCGVANDPRYNTVEMFAGQPSDFAQMLAEAMGGLLVYEEPPDLVLNVIAMDASAGSLYYQRASAAKTLHQAFTTYGALGEDVELEYDEGEQTIGGRAAHVYRLDLRGTTSALESFVMGGGGDMAIYDVYIPHDGKMFWMSIQAMAQRRGVDIPHDVLEHMIGSIELKSS